MDPLGRRVLQRWLENGGGAWDFADSGKAVCMGGNDLQSDRAPAICRNVDTGKVISETQSNGAFPIATAAHATRLVVSDYRRRKIPFSYEYTSTFHGRIVWDFGTGSELAFWMPMESCDSTRLNRESISAAWLKLASIYRDAHAARRGLKITAALTSSAATWDTLAWTAMTSVRTIFQTISPVLLTCCGQPMSASAGKLPHVWQIETKEAIHQTSADNPEPGTMFCTYNADGTLAMKQDMKGT